MEKAFGVCVRKLNKYNLHTQEIKSWLIVMHFTSNSYEVIYAVWLVFAKKVDWKWRGGRVSGKVGRRVGKKTEWKVRMRRLKK